MHLVLLNSVGFGASTFKMGKAERQHSWGLQKVLQELHGYMQPNNVSANYCPISYNMAIIITLQPELNPKSMLLKQFYSGSAGYMHVQKLYKIILS